MSAKDHADIVQTQFQEEAKLGAMVELPLSEARERFGDRLVLACLGAIEKKDGACRVTHDGTHGVGVNSAIRMRDQVRSPTAGDVRTAMRVLQRAHFGLTGDVSRAHRLVKVAAEDWGPSLQNWCGAGRVCLAQQGWHVWCQQCVIPLEQTNGRTRQVSAILAGQDRTDAPGLC